MIKFLDLQAINDVYKAEVSQACERVIESGWYVNGKEVNNFESAFSEMIGVEHAVGVGNGFDALSLTLRAWLTMGKLNKGDEVVVPANTFIATALAVTNNQLKLVLVDIDPNTFNICTKQLELAITRKTRVIIPVHLYGKLAEMQKINLIASKHDLLVLEDAAQAAGASRNGQFAGAFGDAAAFSFYPGKNLGALGDGGMVTTNDSGLATIVRQLANYGSSKKYQHDLDGVNSRLDEMQAAILNAKLPNLHNDNMYRRKIAQRYCVKINNPLVQLPSSSECSSHVWHLFVIKTHYRDDLKKYLAENNIQTLTHYPISIHKQPVYRHCSFPELTTSSVMQEQLLSLPLSPVLTIEDQEYVISAINSFQPSSWSGT